MQINSKKFAFIQINSKFEFTQKKCEFMQQMFEFTQINSEFKFKLKMHEFMQINSIFKFSKPISGKIIYAIRRPYNCPKPSF